MYSLLLLEYIKWHYLNAPRALIKAWGNILWFNFNYFSVFVLLRTLLSPWKGIQWQRARAFTFGNFFETIVSNLIARILGGIVRTILIIVGLGLELLLAGAAIISLLFWIFLPGIILLTLLYGIGFLI
ncbi:MAG: hypothetical protein AAB567_03295 [Patescibacteria group bacterium]